ncbi:EmrB/QacA subfamily drug resistance transporter [Antricoccus suffuscus]|uniref:EmrB/QacA subfamily drug resistance transporter n=1 Tax=Antricoccus suffuscus TaxID=1629062 RepID=A0A2T0ZW74_9ACTN|nr:MFS transporter [Antricoccus suffuscus]PRZ40507.1 EmrB/QacA subfamily drug resistance transporter [Antricoccus suffuscus]
MSSTTSTRNDGQGTPRRTWIGLGVLAAGLSMIVIDGTIVGVALPVIIHKLNLSLGDAQWVNSLYSVVFAALLLSAGRLGDRLGRRKLFVAGIVVFMLGSILAAAATGATSLIMGRLIQGIGGAFVLPATLSTVNATFRGKDRVVAFAVWGAVISGMAAIGPLLGGWLTHSYTWPWIFLVNVPIGIAVLIGTYFTVPESKSEASGRGMDVGGLLLSAAGFGAIVFGLIEGSAVGWWTPVADLHFLGLTWPGSAPISIAPIAAAVGVALLIFFAAAERRRVRNDRSVILDLRLFQISTFAWGNVTAMMVAIGEFGLIFVLPLYLIDALGIGGLGAGLVLGAMGVGAFFSGAAARHLAARVGAAGVVVIGLALEVVGVLATALVVGPTSSPVLIAILVVIYGLGLGLASAQLTSTTLGDVPVALSGQGSATQSTVRQVGAALGTAVVGAVLSTGVGQSDLAGASPGSFSDATRYALYVAAAFLVLGLYGATRVAVAVRRSDVVDQANESVAAR